MKWLSYLTLGGLSIHHLFTASHLHFQEDIIYEQDTPYNKIIITESKTHRSLKFSQMAGFVQSSINKSDPTELVFKYNQRFAEIIKNEAHHIKNALLIGLGAGTLPTHIHHFYPHIEMDIIEIDPALKQISQDYFHFPHDLSVLSQDARIFLPKVKDSYYDLVIIDAFSETHIPHHLVTEEMFSLLSQKMTEKAHLLINVCITQRGDILKSTIETSFKNVVFSKADVNTIIEVQHSKSHVTLPGRLTFTDDWSPVDILLKK